jgi:hypothetical protein
MAAGGEGARPSITDHWDVREVEMMVDCYIKEARQDLETLGER